MSTQRTSRQQPAHYHVNKAGKHVHHGRTPAAWAGTMIALVAFVVGGPALIFQWWAVFWICCALLVVALIVTVVLQKMGFGAY